MYSTPAQAFFNLFYQMLSNFTAKINCNPAKKAGQTVQICFTCLCLKLLIQTVTSLRSFFRDCPELQS